MAINTLDLACAYVKVARVNHYLVTVQPGATDDELDAAEQILITWDNAADNADPVLNLALDLIEHDKRARIEAASRGV